jgi:hypothetical protein
VTAFLVFSAAVLDQAVSVDTAGWQQAVEAVAEAQSGTGKFVCIPVDAIEVTDVTLSGGPTATASADPDAQAKLAEIPQVAP